MTMSSVGNGLLKTASLIQGSATTFGQAAKQVGAQGLDYVVANSPTAKTALNIGLGLSAVGAGYVNRNAMAQTGISLKNKAQAIYVNKKQAPVVKQNKAKQLVNLVGTKLVVAKNAVVSTVQRILQAIKFGLSEAKAGVVSVGQKISSKSPNFKKLGSNIKSAFSKSGKEAKASASVKVK